jgi:hypothetical protein
MVKTTVGFQEAASCLCRTAGVISVILAFLNTFVQTQYVVLKLSGSLNDHTKHLQLEFMYQSLRCNLRFETYVYLFSDDVSEWIVSGICHTATQPNLPKGAASDPIIKF